MKGRREGYGEFKWRGGESYRGEWKEDKMDGYGIYTQKGVEMMGEWRKGREFRAIDQEETDQLDIMVPELPYH